MFQGSRLLLTTGWRTNIIEISAKAICSSAYAPTFTFTLIRDYWWDFCVTILDYSRIGCWKNKLKWENKNSYFVKWHAISCSIWILIMALVNCTQQWWCILWKILTITHKIEIETHNTQSSHVSKTKHHIKQLVKSCGCIYHVKKIGSYKNWQKPKKLPATACKLSWLTVTTAVKMWMGLWKLSHIDTWQGYRGYH